MILQLYSIGKGDGNENVHYYYYLQIASSRSYALTLQERCLSHFRVVAEKSSSVLFVALTSLLQKEDFKPYFLF